MRNSGKNVQHTVEYVLETQEVYLDWRHSFESHGTYEVVRSKQGYLGIAYIAWL